MSPPDKNLKPKPKDKDTTVLLTLSLFLLLLAFFILLNSISLIQEEKSARIMRSVSATFQRNILETLDLQLLVSTFGETPNASEIIEEIEVLWVTAASIVNISKSYNGELLSLDLKATELFVPGSSKLRQDREIFLQNVAIALSKTYPTLEVSMQLLMGASDFEAIETRQVEAPDKEALRKAREQIAKETPIDIYDPNTFADIIPARKEELISTVLEGKNLSFGRAVSFGKYLESQGVEKRKIAVGFRNHDPALIKIRLYVSRPLILDAKPLQNFLFG